MKKETTYYVLRDGSYAWLGRGIEPLETDTEIEERVMLFADDGKMLQKDDFVCSCVWLKDGDTEDNWEEIDPPPPEEDEPEEEDES